MVMCRAARVNSSMGCGDQGDDYNFKHGYGERISSCVKNVLLLLTTFIATFGHDSCGHGNAALRKH